MGETEWAYLKKLVKKYPNIKITMFTIPEQCSPEWIKKVKKYKWLELAVHGTDHRSKSQIPTNLIKGFTEWFKAPQWKLTEEECFLLRRKGFKVATNKTNKYAGDYVYDSGKEILKDVCYDLGKFRSWHGHVQSQLPYNKLNPNGLPDIYKTFLELVPLDSEFIFVSEVEKC